MTKTLLICERVSSEEFHWEQHTANIISNLKGLCFKTFYCGNLYNIALIYSVCLSLLQFFPKIEYEGLRVHQK